MFLIKPPYLYRKLLSRAAFNMGDDKVHLTFDDGPDPDVTPQVLNILKQENVTATFFVLGENAEKHPRIIEIMKSEGHQVANHGFAHLDGWKIDKNVFIENVERGANVSGSHAFRPPHGRIWPGLMEIIPDHRVIMWDVLSGDFDSALSVDQVINNVLNNVQRGSIIVMHDSQKAQQNVIGSLKQIIEGVQMRGLRFGSSHDLKGVD